MSIEAQASPAEAMHRALADADLRQDPRRRLERTSGFTWEQTARETATVCKEVPHF